MPSFYLYYRFLNPFSKREARPIVRNGLRCVLFVSLFSNSLPQLLSSCGLDVFQTPLVKEYSFITVIQLISLVLLLTVTCIVRDVFPGRVHEVEAKSSLGTAVKRSSRLVHRLIADAKYAELKPAFPAAQFPTCVFESASQTHEFDLLTLLLARGSLKKSFGV